ncbi:DUF4153 domain-containing protein [Virgibacillus kekensis]|uniref:DUF4153 domain-containing protein n=1 Tax=Virgibacillus kekensis TaxID=202261 RepID=A0ABV9DPR9_9BACI
MDAEVKQKDWMFLLVCLGLGVLAELSFFHGMIGVSYLVFLTGFYGVVFYRFRQTFTHRRIGLLVMVCIWMLAAGYLLYDNVFFYVLNLLAIPFLVYFHIVLITSPNNLKWSRPKFAVRLAAKFGQGMKYCAFFFNKTFRRVFRNLNEQTAQTVKRVLVGLVIGVPLLFLITALLMSADAVFQEMILELPMFILDLNFLESVFRTAAVMIFTFLFFGILQVLVVKTKKSSPKPVQESGTTAISLNSVTAVTILILLNTVYVLFAVVQFTYFFGDGLQEGYTFAEYARRGFFELVIVTMINWTILICCLKLITDMRDSMKRFLKLMYSLLIIVSGVMLASAYQRLSMYEAAYGFTLDRLLAHAFMIFLMVIFAYTLIRVWIEGIELLHFYLIAGLICYTVLNVVHIEQLVVEENLERYEDTGKLDIHYLNTLGYTGIEGLIELYKQEPEYPELERILYYRQLHMKEQTLNSWQSYNFTKRDVREELMKLDLERQ